MIGAQLMLCALLAMPTTISKRQGRYDVAQIVDLLLKD